MSTERSVTLSDGSVWGFLGQGRSQMTGIPLGNFWTCRTGAEHQMANVSMLPFRDDSKQLTAADHRAIADVLDPPAERAPRERTEWRTDEKVRVARLSAMNAITASMNRILASLGSDLRANVVTPDSSALDALCDAVASCVAASPARSEAPKFEELKRTVDLLQEILGGEASR